MANESLVISISADQKAALAGLKQLNDQLLQLEKALKKTSDTAGIIKLQDQIRNLKAEMSSLNEVAQGKLVKGTNQAANALTNLGRVAQDSPYGFIGIQNNLNPLLESFQRLKAETGSTGTALKALGAGLMGPAGIGVALSVASALLVTFGDDLMSASKETVALNKAQTAFSDTLSKSMGSAKAEIATIQSLVAITNDVTVSTDERKRALNQLKEAYPGYNQLQKVDINDAATLKNVTDNLSDAIMRKARIQAYSTIIAEEEAKQFKIAIENDKDRANRLGSVSKAINDYIVPLMSLTDATTANIVKNKLAVDAVDKASESYDFGSKYLSKMKDMLNATTKEQNKFNDAQMLGAAPKGGGAKFKATPLDNYLATANVVDKSGFKPVDTSLVSIPYTGNTGVKSLENLTLGNSLLMQREQLILANYNADVLFNEQQAMANELATAGTSLFTSMGNALLYGQDMGEALTNTLKKIVLDLTAAIAKALIFKALMAAFTGGGSLVASGAAGAIGGAAGGAASGGGGGFFGFLSGNNILMGQNRTRTSMGLRRG
jgi:hypothetical protein